MVGCAQTAEVFKSKDGKYEVKGVASDKETSINIAKRSAKEFCKQKTLTPVIHSEKTSYEGRYSEETNKGIKTAAEVGSILTGNYSLQQAGDAARGRANYKTLVRFTCEN